MNLKFPFWSLFLAVASYFFIEYFNINRYFAIIPTLYLGTAFITLSISAIKRTFFNDNKNKKRNS